MRNATRAFTGVLPSAIALLVLCCGRQEPDRTNAVQVPLFILILVMPVISVILRRIYFHLPILLLAVQIGTYALYESGISVETNIRIDLLLILPALSLNFWIAVRAFDRTREHDNSG